MGGRIPRDRLPEDPADTKPHAPPAVEARAGAEKDWTDRRLGHEADANLAVEVGILTGIEDGAVFEPEAAEDRSAKKIREPAKASQPAERQYGVVIPPAFARGEGVEYERTADRELTRRQRVIAERRSAGKAGEQPVLVTHRMERRHGQLSLREICVRPCGARNFGRRDRLRQRREEASTSRGNHLAVLLIDDPSEPRDRLGAAKLGKSRVARLNAVVDASHVETARQLAHPAQIDSRITLRPDAALLVFGDDRVVGDEVERVFVGA